MGRMLLCLATRLRGVTMFKVEMAGVRIVFNTKPTLVKQEYTVVQFHYFHHQSPPPPPIRSAPEKCIFV